MPNKKYCCLLNQYMPNYFFYSIGISGHSLPYNIKNLYNAYTFYKPRKGVVIEIDNLIYENFTQIVFGGKKKRINNKGLFYLLKNYFPVVNSLGREIFSQFDLWVKSSKLNFFQDRENNFDLQKQVPNFDDKEIDLQKVMLFARKNVPNHIPIIIIYHPSGLRLKKDGSLDLDTKNNLFKIHFKKVCEKNNIIFVDMTDDITCFYYNNHILSYGFINTKVGYGHLNKYGHELIAKRLVKEINKLSEVTQ